MTTPRHAVRLTREQNLSLRRTALEQDTSKAMHLASIIEKIAAAGPPAAPDYIVTKVPVSDETWAQVTAIAKARGVTVSTLIAEAVA